MPSMIIVLVLSLAETGVNSGNSSNSPFYCNNKSSSSYTSIVDYPSCLLFFFSQMFVSIARHVRYLLSFMIGILHNFLIKD